MRNTINLYNIKKYCNNTINMTNLSDINNNKNHINKNYKNNN